MQRDASYVKYRVMVWLVAAVIILGGLASGLAIWSLHVDTIDDAVADAHNIATVLSEQTASSVQSIDLVLHDMLERVEALGVETPADFERQIGTEAVNGFLKDRLARLPQASVLGLIDRNGQLLNSTRGWPVHRIDVAHRDHFQFAKNGDGRQLYISAPVRAFANGSPIIYFSKRIQNNAGEFLGVASVGVGPEYFRNIYSSITPLQGESFVLLRSDGTIFLRYPDVNIRSGEKVPATSAWYEQVANGGGTYQTVGIFDHIERWIAVQPLQAYPLVINVGISQHAALAKWGYRASVIGGGASLTLLCLGFLLWHMTSQFHELMRSEDILAKRSQELEQTNVKFNVALNTMTHGLCMFDADKRFVVCNAHYAEIYRLPPELLTPGTPHGAIIAHRVGNGILKGDERALRDHAHSIIGLGTDCRSVRVDEHADGKLIRVVREPMQGGGWVATHEDITEQRKAELELDDTKRFLDSILKNIPVAVVVKDAKTLQYLFVNRAFETLAERPASELLGRTVFDVFRFEDAKGFDDADRQVLRGSEGGEPRESVSRTMNRGARVQMSSRIVVTDSRGEPKYLITVIEDVTERKKSEQRIAFLAHHDALTGLANRAALAEKIEEAAARQRRRGEPFSVLLLDLDRFKQVNDTLGHPAGDALLMNVAMRLKDVLGEVDVLARLGGDEFAVIQSGESNQRATAAALAERVIELLTKPFDIDGNEVTIGTSIGIALAPEHATGSDDLLKMADLALYRVKAAGRNGYRFFDPEMSESASTRHAVESDLRRAIHQNEFELHYQPVIDSQSGRIDGAEALIRWRHPTKGFVLPDNFIPLAEETGLVGRIGEWALRAACAEAATWPSRVKIAVNLSAVQFRRADLVDIVSRALNDSGLPPRRLELEITETALIESAAESLPALRRFKNLGITIVLDDFGTGYSSLSQLTMFPFDKIKIDRSFTQNLTKRSECAAIILATLTLAQSLDIKTTAEGVETMDQFRLLKLAGVTSLQGYLFKRPGPACEMDFDRVYGGESADAAA